MKKVHFHSLDALRFFAFLKVYLLHVPLQGDFPIFSFLKSGGGIGVSFFFVLSGFLITYLLVFEKLQIGQINVKKFLIRRSLRIWPLYYLIVIIVFLLPFEFKDFIGLHMNGGGYHFDWKYSFTFLENYKMLIEDNPPITSPLSVFWSLCIEEHFYLFWIICLFFIPVKYIFRFFIFCFIIAWNARLFEYLYLDNTNVTTNDLFTNLDFFASGGILGYLVAKDYEKIAGIIQNIPYWIKSFVMLCILLIVIFQKQILPYNPESIFILIRPTIIAILFTILLSLFIPINSNFKIKSKALSYLGSISYGLYVYHLIFIHIVFQYFINKNIKIDDWQTASIFILLTLGLSIIISSFSYHFFEKPFLSFRERFFNKENS